MNRTRPIIFGLILLALFCCPSAAMANMGTPLMWAGFLHLAIGNAFIGLGEGALIAWVFKASVTRCAVIMIVANYFSAIAGMCAIDWAREHLNPSLLGEAPLYNAPRLMWEMGIATYLVTLLLEWPFCLFAVWRKEHRWTRSLVATLLAQTASYALLVPFYLSASGLTLYTRTELDPTLSFATNRSAWIYFISVNDGDIYRVHPDGTGKIKVLGVNIKNPDTRLIALNSKVGKGCDVWQVEGQGNKGKQKLLWNNFAVFAGDLDETDLTGTYFGFHRSTDLRTKENRLWNAASGHWPSEGLRAFNSKTGETIRIALETPFIKDWWSRNVTILPGDQLVYQLGEHVVLLDLTSRKLGLVTMGRGPVVVFESKP